MEDLGTGGIGIGIATALRYQCGVFGLGWSSRCWCMNAKPTSRSQQRHHRLCSHASLCPGATPKCYLGRAVRAVKGLHRIQFDPRRRYPQFLLSIRLGGLGTSDPTFAGLGSAQHAKPDASRSSSHLAFFLFHSAFPTSKSASSFLPCRLLLPRGAWLARLH